jgi:putative PIN family toxin of toxin-antitoxin system
MDRPILRVVIDTNLFVSGVINVHGLPRRLLEAWYAGQVLVLTEASLLAEVIRVLERPRIRTKYGLTPERITELQERIVRTAELVTPLSPLPAHSRDAHDNNFLAVALGGNAEYLITGDDDLLVLDGHPALGRLRIVTVHDFLEILAERGAELA